MAESPFFEGFPNVELPIAFRQWERLPRNPSYKYEYYDGRAVLSPRPAARTAVLDLSTAKCRPAPHRAAVRTMVEDDWSDLPRVFYSGFVGEMPFHILSERKGRALAKACLKFTRDGGDGPLLPEACVVAEEEERIVGAALVTMLPGWRIDDSLGEALIPHLTWIFVSRWTARHGVGATLLDAVVERLRAVRHDTLASSFLPGSSSSVLWHWLMGFRLLPAFPRFM